MAHRKAEHSSSVSPVMAVALELPHTLAEVELSVSPSLKCTRSLKGVWLVHTVFATLTALWVEVEEGWWRGGGGGGAPVGVAWRQEGDRGDPEPPAAEPVSLGHLEHGEEEEVEEEEEEVEEVEEVEEEVPLGHLEDAA